MHTMDRRILDIDLNLQVRFKDGTPEDGWVPFAAYKRPDESIIVSLVNTNRNDVVMIMRVELECLLSWNQGLLKESFLIY